MITGANFIGYNTSLQGTNTYQAFDIAHNTGLPELFHTATAEELASALSLAGEAFTAYREISAQKKAAFLNEIAKNIMDLGDELIGRCVAESGLPVGRITGERARTCGQLQLFAQLLEDGWWTGARIDTGDPERKPAPKPDIRRMLIPIGPVAVFGASNFPLAFSTAGGDTASALAAGCPVIVKAHPSHPGTNELVAGAIIAAAKATGMPEGVFSLLHLSNEQAVSLVQHPAIRAVGFTGSRKAGMILFHAAVQRPDPIPVYAEMSAVNPVIILEGASVQRKDKIAQGLAGSVTLGVGQFCTNPGLVFMIDNEATRAFLESFAAAFRSTVPGTMLNKNICEAYHKGVSALRKIPGVTLLAEAAQGAQQYEGQPVAFSVKAEIFLSHPELSAEVFGPTTLVVLCNNAEQLLSLLESLEGQLTATIHAEEKDEEMVRAVASIITQKAGRIIYNGFPTGVEVCHSMQHGGPFPSTTDARTTSVGTAAIERFVRPVAYQDFPDHLLPEVLQKANPLKILRLVNGKFEC